MERVPEAVDVLKAEAEVRSLWQKQRLLGALMELGRGKPRFRYLEGPPTVNSFMHVGHARGRTIKDVYLRWKGMQGYDVWRQAGWDCQGLPVELEIERNLKLTSKKEIEEKVGVARFIALCKELVDSYVDHWRNTSERLGLSLDYDAAYETRRDVYIDVAWSTLKRAHEKGMLVEDFKVIPFCPRCETPLSGHEVAQGYDTARDPSVYVKFPLAERSGNFVLIWTTTPWTLLANEAVAVHPEVTYAYVRVGGERWLLASPLVERVMAELNVKNFEAEATARGSDLVGLSYEHPFAEEIAAHKGHNGKNDHKILPAEYVTLEEGTGCVHTAPGHGPDDFTLGKKFGLPIFCPVNQAGRYTSEAGRFEGMRVKESDPKIIQVLRKKGLLAFSGEIEHTYPFCWRCDTPLLYRADLQWFLRADPVRKRMLEENLKVKWRPEWAGENRFHEWLKNAGDWCISRARYWGTPLNVWTCQTCRERTVIGSKAELLKEARRFPEGFELHRPWVDQVELRCRRCGGAMKREPPVLDAWFDSGVAHTASFENLSSKPPFDELFPFEFITEAIDQTRGWFYVLLFTGVLLYDKSPYQSVLCQEFVLDPDGKKMSKSKGNTVWAKETMNEVGSDPLRLYLLGMSSPWDAVPYRSEELDLYRRKLRIVFNVFSFATTYMTLDRYAPTQDSLSQSRSALTLEDKWILSRTQAMISEVSGALESQRPDDAVRALLDFAVEDLSREYLRSVKRRVWLEEESHEKLAAYSTLYYVLERFLRGLAPFAPHLSEWLYQRFADPGVEKLESVHFAEWPTAENEWKNPELEVQVKVLQEAAAAAAAARQKARLKLRWPVSKVLISPLNEEAYRALTSHSDFLSRAMNARTIDILKPGERMLETVLQVKPNLKTLGGKYRERLAQVLAALNRLPPEEVRDRLQRNENLMISLPDGGGTAQIAKEDVSILETAPSFYAEAESKNARLWLDTRRDRDLESEALARELVRRVQAMRKEMGLRVEEFVKVEIVFEEEEDLELVKVQAVYLRGETRAEEIELSTKPKTVHRSKGLQRDWDLDGRKVTIKITRAKTLKRRAQPRIRET